MRRITLLATLALAVTTSCTNRPNLEDGFVDTNGTTLYYNTMGSDEISHTLLDGSLHSEF